MLPHAARGITEPLRLKLTIGLGDLSAKAAHQ